MSPKLFTSTLGNTFIQLYWKDKALSIHETNLTHIVFAYDIVIISSDNNVLKIILKELQKISNKLDLHLKRTKIMTDWQTIEHVDENIYLGQSTKIGKQNLISDISWKA